MLIVNSRYKEHLENVVEGRENVFKSLSIQSQLIESRLCDANIAEARIPFSIPSFRYPV